MSTHVQGVQGGVGTTSVNKIVVWNTKPEKVSEQKCPISICLAHVCLYVF